MSRKVLLSFLGTNDYVPCHYYDEATGKKKSPLVKYVQIALIDLYCSDFSDNDKAFFFLTKDAKSMNWEDNGQFNIHTKKYDKENVGLQTELENFKREKKGKFSYKFNDIEEGFSSNQIWSIFNSVTKCVTEGDEIILDITHAFRSIPMLGMVMINYLKAIKNITIRGIYYGAFEKLGRASDVLKLTEEKRLAPIVDLKIFSELQDWTIAADNFVRYGKTDMLSKMLEGPVKNLAREFQGKEKNFNILRKLIRQLEDFSKDIETNRGINLFKTDFITIKEDLSQVLKGDDIYLAAYQASLSSVSKKIEKLDQKDPLNFINIAEWCRKHGLIQQGITVLKEGITTYFLKKYEKDIINRDAREKIDRALYSLCSNCQEIKPDPIFINPLEEDKEAKSLANDFFHFAVNIRNDINHNGMRSDSVKSETIINNFDSFLEKVIDVLKKNDLKVRSETKMLLNLSNHPSANWPHGQWNTAIEQFGSVQDLPFPQINPNANADEIEQLAEEYETKVRLLNPSAIHIMGEMTFTYKLVNRLKAIGISCIASTTERTTEEENGTKTSVFKFVRFRSY